MNISPDFDAKAQLTACRSTYKHAMRLFPPVWTQSNLIEVTYSLLGNSISSLIQLFYKSKVILINSNLIQVRINIIAIENINDNVYNEEVNTSKVKLNKEDNILTELNTDDDEEEAPHMNVNCNEELNKEDIDSIKFVYDSEDF